jgi:hypothetical protein
MKSTKILPALGLLLTLTACGSGGSSGSAGSAGSGGSSAPPSGAAAPPSSAAAAGNTSSAGPVDVCTILSAADVSRITGVHYTKTKSSSVEGQIFECEYSNAQYALLQVSLTTVNGAIGYNADVQAMSALQKPLTVSGVGDKAFAVPDPKGNAGSAGVAAFASYGALFGDQYVKIGGSYVTPDQGKQIVEQVHAAG